MKKCKATLQLGDDHGDNSTTFHCQRERGHKGMHQEGGNLDGRVFTMTWKDERSGRKKFLDWLDNAIYAVQSALFRIGRKARHWWYKVKWMFSKKPVTIATPFDFWDNPEDSHYDRL